MAHGVMVAHLILIHVVRVRILMGLPVLYRISSVEEQCFDKAEVAGSIPASATSFFA